jgi:ribosome-associated heat shock protein Hsp15
VNRPDDTDTRHRLDKWLWCARFFKTRGLATTAVTGGRIKVNGERVKPAHDLRVGDRLTLSLNDEPMEVDVLDFPVRRGPASEARACYTETPESLKRREVLREQRRLAAMARPRPDTKPDKRERRQMEKFWRDQD